MFNMLDKSEEHNKVITKSLEGFIREYEGYKQFLEEATEEMKQTPRYQHCKTIVDGVDKFYPTLTDDMKIVFDMHYKQNIDDFAEIADQILVKTHVAMRIRDRIIDRFAVLIGWKWAV